jgi:putative transposase
MTRSRFREEQIIGVWKEGEAGLEVEEICRKHGICAQTYYRWEAKYVGMEVNEARRRQLEDENRRLKQIVADLTLDNQALKTALAKGPADGGGGTSASGDPDPAEPALLDGFYYGCSACGAEVSEPEHRG